jgi:outer membrane protein TolC
LCGCATFTSEPIDAPSSMLAFESRSLEDPDLRRYVSAHLPLHEPSAAPAWDLESLMVVAYFYSPELDVARARGAVADAAVRSAAQRPTPSLQGPFVYRFDAKPEDSPYTLGLGLDLPIETAGKRGYRVAQAKHLSIVSRLEIGAAAWQVRSRLRTHLATMHFAQRRIRLLTQQVKLRERIKQLFDEQRAPSALLTVEALKAQAAHVQAKAELARAEAQLLGAQAGAAATIGLPLAALRHADIRLDAFDEPTPDVPAMVVRERALLNRADVQAALANYEASQAALQREVANQYLSIHLGPGYVYDTGAHKFMLPFSGIPLPLFHLNEGPIAEAEARRREAAARFGAVQARVIAQADQAVERWRAAQVLLHLADSLLDVRHLQLAATKELTATAADRLAIMAAELEVCGSELQREDALLGMQSAIGELEDAMQRPLAQPSGT